jgi:hypothetical protein
MKEIERESQVFRFAVNVHFPSAFFSFFFFPFFLSTGIETICI